MCYEKTCIMFNMQITKCDRNTLSFNDSHYIVQIITSFGQAELDNSMYSIVPLYRQVFGTPFIMFVCHLEAFVSGIYL